MKVLTAAAMREADRRTMEELGLPGPVLMETAAMRVAEAVFALKLKRGRVVVAAGPGNNGGDGLALARILTNGGLEVSLWSTVEAGGYRGDAAVQEGFLMRCGFPVGRLAEAEALQRFKEDLSGAALVVDALLGTGVNRPVEGLAAKVISAINESGAPVLSVDLPSGVYADSGEAPGCAVQARWTVTLACPKRGLLLYPGAALAGEVLVGQIHIPGFLLEEAPAEVFTAAQAQALLPRRPADMHKGSAGRVLIVAGSPGMSGAAAMAARAALMGGAGLVYLAAPQSICPALEAKLMEVIVLPLPETAPGVIAAQAAELLLERAASCGAVAAGPGLIPAPETRALVEALLERCPVPLVLDAGALAALAGEPGLLRRARQAPVITPHAGEMGRLAGLDAEAVQRARPETALRGAADWRCTVVLKGAYTLIATPEGRLTFNPSGGPALATAGTGDLLTGLIASLIAQGLEPGEAARVGAFIHGLAGDLVPGGRSSWPPCSEAGESERLGSPRRGYTAGHILELFPQAFAALEQAAHQPSPWGPFLTPLRPTL